MVKERRVVMVTLEEKWRRMKRREEMRRILGVCSSGSVGGGKAWALPHDLVVSELLTRLPCKPLARFKCVSNLWRSSIEDDCFQKVHYSRSLSRGGKLLFVCPDFHDNLWFFHCTPSRSRSGSRLDLVCQITVDGKMYDGFNEVVNGLVCAYKGHSMWVCKVSTNCCVELPPCFNSPRRQKFRFYLGFDSTRNEYKLLKVLFRSDPGSSHEFYFSFDCEILTLGKDDDWRSIPSGNIPIDIWGESVFLHGSSTLFFWSMYSRTLLVAFSFKEEVFDMVSFPFKSHDHRLLQFGDHLSLVEGFVDQKLVLWVYGGKMPTKEEKGGAEQDLDVDHYVDDNEQEAAAAAAEQDLDVDHYVDDNEQEAAAAAAAEQDLDVDVVDDYVGDNEQEAAAEQDIDVAVDVVDDYVDDNEAAAAAETWT